MSLVVLVSLMLVFMVHYALKYFGKNYAHFYKLRKLRDSVFYNMFLRTYLQMYAKTTFVTCGAVIYATQRATPITYLLFCLTAVTPFFSYLIMKKL